MQERPSIVELRKSRNMSQADLASAVGVSQATISRLEKDEGAATIQALAKIARVFAYDLRDLLPPDRLRELSGAFVGDEFYAFCPNPFCRDNTTGVKDGIPTVTWKSGKSYETELFEETNFCPSCGTELAKECPSCSRKLERNAKYCIACGKEITNHPTEDEWKRIKSLHTPTEFDDDIPF